jgi:hypothetical protein
MSRPKGEEEVLIYDFTVEGRGAFPVDMLRHDQCWPMLPDDSAAIMGYDAWGQKHVNKVDDGELRQVRLLGLKSPTVSRWSSFMWDVVEINDV